MPTLSICNVLYICMLSLGYIYWYIAWLIKLSVSISLSIFVYLSWYKKYWISPKARVPTSGLSPDLANCIVKQYRSDSKIAINMVYRCVGCAVYVISRGPRVCWVYVLFVRVCVAQLGLTCIWPNYVKWTVWKVVWQEHLLWERRQNNYCRTLVRF